MVSVGETERGIVRQRHRDPALARVLAAWWDSVLALYGERILAVGVSTASRWGRPSGDLGHEGADLLIAATALEHGLTVVTRNVRHFEPTGGPVAGPVRAPWLKQCASRPLPAGSNADILRLLVSMSRASGEPTFIIDQHHPGRTLGIPSPHHEIDIVDARPGGEAADSHARISRRNQAIRQRLRCWDTSCEHLGLPGGTGEVGVEHAQCPAPLFVQGIEDGLRIDLVRAKGERLHRSAERLRFTYGDQRGQGSVERRKPAPIEAPAVTARSLARQGRPGPLRVVCPVDQPPEPHQERARSRIAARHHPVETGMHVIGPAFAHQQIRRGAAEARQRLGAKPGIRRER